MGDEDRLYKELFEELFGDPVEYNLELDPEERKELDDMLAQRENEDVRSFKDHWIDRLERAAREEGGRPTRRP